MRTLLSALLLVLSPALAAQAQMYKCVDAKGVTRYSDKPLSDCKGREVDIRGQPPISGKLNERTEDVGGQERDFQRRQIERGRDEELEARRLAEEKRRCAALRAELERLATVQRISRVDEKGQRIYMDDATREAYSAQLRTVIEQRCR